MNVKKKRRKIIFILLWSNTNEEDSNVIRLIKPKEIDLIINYQDLDKVLKLKTIYNIKIVRYYGKLRIIKRMEKVSWNIKMVIY